MSRFWPEGQSLDLVADAAGDPQRFRWRQTTHRVAGIAKRWRVDQGWWRWRIWRDYYKLYTDSGLLVIVYRDLDGDGWYLQRLYD